MFELLCRHIGADSEELWSDEGSLAIAGFKIKEREQLVKRNAEEIKLLRRTAEDAHSVADDLKDRVAKLERSKEAIEKELQGYKDECTSHDEEMEKLRAELAAAQQTGAGGQLEVGRLNAALRKATEDKATAQKDWDRVGIEVGEKLKRANEELKLARRELAGKTAALEKSSKELKAKIFEANQAKSATADHQARLDIALEERTAARNEADSFAADLRAEFEASLYELFEGAKGTSATVRAELDAAAAMRATSKTSLDEAASSAAAVRTELEKDKESASKLRDLWAQLVREARTSRDGAKAAMDKAEEQRVEAEVELGAIKQLKQETEADAAAVKSMKRLMEEELEACRKLRTEAEESVKGAQEAGTRIDAVEKDITSSKDRTETLELSVKTTRDTAHTLLHDLQAACSAAQNVFIMLLIGLSAMFNRAYVLVNWIGQAHTRARGGAAVIGGLQQQVELTAASAKDNIDALVIDTADALQGATDLHLRNCQLAATLAGRYAREAEQAKVALDELAAAAQAARAKANDDLGRFKDGMTLIRSVKQTIEQAVTDVSGAGWLTADPRAKRRSPPCRFKRRNACRRHSKASTRSCARSSPRRSDGGRPRPSMHVSRRL